MNAKDLIQAAKLSEARSHLIKAVKASPDDQSSRTLLFQVLAYTGEWDKARRHLEIIAAQDSTRQTGVQIYLNLVQAEIERIEVVHKKRPPAFLPKSPAYLKQYEYACQKLDNRQYQEAATVFKEIDNQRPSISGTLNDKNFNGFRDKDTRLSCFLEVFVHERYVWLPFEFLRELSCPRPQTLLDLLWTSAQITTWDGLTLNCFLPVLYPESFRHEDDRLKLGRMTDWMDLGEGFYQGVGQHVFHSGEEDISILEIEKSAFKPTELGQKHETCD